MNPSTSPWFSRALLIAGVVVFAAAGFLVGEVFLGESLRRAPDPQQQRFAPEDRDLPEDVRISDIAVLHGQPQVIEIATDKGLFESADGGFSFSSIAGEFVFAKMTGFAFEPSSPDINFGSGRDLRSTKMGMIRGGKGTDPSDVILGDIDVSAIAAHPETRGLVAAADRDRLRVSIDNGAHWVAIALPEGVSSPDDIAISGESVAAGAKAGGGVTALVVSGGELWRLPMGRKAARLSAKTKPEWVKVPLPTGDSTAPVSSVAGVPGGFYVASDIVLRGDGLAREWARVGETGAGTLSELAVSLPAGDRIYGVVAGNDILVSTDSGRSWAPPEEER